jgi:hypothetical protein
MAEATSGGIEALARFARGLQEDLAVVSAGLTLEWSNGLTEGQIHRLKLLKRQGYGRCGFALLRQRVLQAASRWRVLTSRGQNASQGGGQVHRSGRIPNSRHCASLGGGKASAFA